MPSPNTPPGQLRQKDHSLNVVVLQQMDVGAHVGDGAHIDHHHVIYLGELLLVEAT